METILKEFTTLTKQPEQYVSEQLQYLNNFKLITKSLYDMSKQVEEITKTNIKNSLPNLIIKNFDEEQIWQQVELQNKPSVRELYKSLKVLNSCPSIKLEKKPFSSKELEMQGMNKITVSLKTNDLAKQNIQKKVNLLSRPKKVNLLSSVVDDKFFKLRELEDFLNNEDLKETENEFESEEDNIDYFSNYFSDDENEKNDEYNYEDFFDPPEDEDTHEVENDTCFRLDSSNEDSEVEELEVRDCDTRDIDDDEIKLLKKNNEKSIKICENNEDSDDDKNVNTQYSTYQKQQEKLKMKIKEMEEEQLMLEKPWQLKGEVKKLDRPENSLLEDHLRFDHVSHPAPTITEDFTKKIENIIKQRIKDKAWDDVEKKIKPQEKRFELKHHIVIDEKSKKSLAEIYEDEFIKKQERKNDLEDDKEPEKHKEIKIAMNALFTKLDSLSNFQFHPRPPVPDIKVVNNLPAVTVEEVAPVIVSDVALLAPEEIKPKSKGVQKGKTERESTDKKRERRKKKLHQKIKNKEKEKKLIKKLGLGNKYSKQEALKKLKNEENTKIVKESKMDTSLKSSTAFFKKLTDKV